MGDSQKIGDTREGPRSLYRLLIAARVRQNGVVVGGIQEEAPASRDGMGVTQMQDPPGELQQQVGLSHLDGRRQVRIARNLDERKRQDAQVDH